jgi:hypothetical protein
LLFILGIIYFYFVKKKKKGNISKIFVLIAVVFFSSKIFYDNFFKYTVEPLENANDKIEALTKFHNIIIDESSNINDWGNIRIDIIAFFDKLTAEDPTLVEDPTLTNDINNSNTAIKNFIDNIIGLFKKKNISDKNNIIHIINNVKEIEKTFINVITNIKKIKNKEVVMKIIKFIDNKKNTKQDFYDKAFSLFQNEWRSIKTMDETSLEAYKNESLSNDNPKSQVAINEIQDTISSTNTNMKEFTNTVVEKQKQTDIMLNKINDKLSSIQNAQRQNINGSSQNVPLQNTNTLNPENLAVN